jgi:hypothetical protein
VRHGEFSANFGKGWWNPTSGSGTCPRRSERGGVGRSGAARPARRKGIGKREARGGFFCTEAEGNGGSVRARPRGRREKERGGPVRAAPRRGRVGGLASGSCARAVEAGVGRAASGAMQKQGSGRRAWAARESVGRPGEGK